MSDRNCAIQKLPKRLESPSVEKESSAIITSPNKKEASDSSVLDDSFFAGVTSYDVLLGRGKDFYNHAGNERLREIVNKKQPLFGKASETEKDSIARDIVAMVKNSGNRFLQRDSQSGEWNVATDKKAHACVLRIAYFGSRFRKWQPKVITASAADAAVAAKPSEDTDNQKVSTDDNQNTAKLPATSTLDELMLKGVTSNDVLWGQESYVLNHDGNKKLKDMIDHQRLPYVDALKTYHTYREKREKQDDIIRRLVGMVRISGGRFLKRDPQAGKWNEVDNYTAFEKIRNEMNLLTRHCSSHFNSNRNTSNRSSPSLSDNVSLVGVAPDDVLFDRRQLFHDHSGNKKLKKLV